MWSGVKAFQESAMNTLSGATKPESDGEAPGPAADQAAVAGEQQPQPENQTESFPLPPKETDPGSPSGSDATEGPDPEDQQLSPDKDVPQPVINLEKPGDLSVNGGQPQSPNAATSPTQNAQAAVQAGMQGITEASAKALNTAKTFGTNLGDSAKSFGSNFGGLIAGFGKAATEKVAKTAKQVKEVVEEKTILGDFSKEQEKFVADKKEKEGRQEAAVPPWVGYNEEKAMKEQILALSTDKRNFLRNPPAGVNFQFEFETAYPVAMATLAEDPNLEKMRFELVPKQLTEETFWRNYLYRVSLIKQSAQLSSLAQQTGASGETISDPVSQNAESTVSSSNKDPMEMVSKTKRVSDKEEDMVPGSSPPEHEFISDAFAGSQIDEDALRKEMQQLGMDDTKPKPPTAEAFAGRQ